MQRPRWIFVAATAVLALVTAGCSGDELPPLPVPTTPSAQPPARYSAIAGGCPTLTSPEAKKFNATGRGKPVVLSAQPPGYSTTVRCTWPTGRFPTLRVTVDFFANGLVPTGTGAGNAKQYFADVHAEADKVAAVATLRAEVNEVDTPAGPALLGALGSDHKFVRSTLVDNVVIEVAIQDREANDPGGPSQPADLRRRLSPATEAVTAEVLGQLR